MAKYEGQDHYLDAETGVLKNRLGIGDENELTKAEASLVACREFQLFKKPIRGLFDRDHLKAIHKHLFQDVYEWAGQLRDIDLIKGTSHFANHPHIANAARPIFEKLAKEGCLRGLDASAFSERAAYYLGGRAQREFINHSAYANSYCIQWKNVSTEDMIQASKESFHKGDNTRFAASRLKP